MKNCNNIQKYIIIRAKIHNTCLTKEVKNFVQYYTGIKCKL